MGSAAVDAFGPVRAQEPASDGDAGDAVPPVEPDLEEALGFLSAHLPNGLVHLVSIHPKTSQVGGQTFARSDAAGLRRWIGAREGRANLYHSVNDAGRPLRKSKLAKADIRQVRAIWADLDPHKAEEAADRGRERQRLHRLAGELHRWDHPPTVIVDSGNGIQALWMLVEPVAAAAFGSRAERIGKTIERMLGGRENTSNLDRILRLPGTRNLPEARKLARP